MNTTEIKANDTRYPSLTRAIIRTVGRESLEDVARHSADAGWPGFTYTRDCVLFFMRHRKDIMDLAKQCADDFGQDVLEMVAGFNCLKDLKLQPYDVALALDGRGKDADTVRNAMAWFALEEIARELNPDI